MKHIKVGVLLLLCLLAIPSSSPAFPRLDVDTAIGFLPVKLHRSDGIYLYGSTSANLIRIDQYWRVFYGRTLSGQIKDVWTTTTPGLVFIVVADGTAYDLYRSTDYGETATKVDDIGLAYAGGQAAGFYILDHGFLDVNGVLYYGDYTENSTEGKVRLRKSTDNGVTWTTIVTFNSDSENPREYIRHIHCLLADPTNSRYIYVGTGDEADECSLIRWDTQSGSWADDQHPVYYATAEGFAYIGGAVGPCDGCTNDQNPRPINIVFSGGNIIWFQDSSKATARGIWRVGKGLNAQPVRVNNDISNYTTKLGWSGLVLPSGSVIFGDVVETDSDTNEIHIYGSSDGGATFKIIGSILTQNDADKDYCRIISHAGKVIISNINGNIHLKSGDTSGSYSGSFILTESGTLSVSDDPIIFHPVFWYDTVNGVDSSSGVNRGWSALFPWKTLAYAQAQSKSVTGARIVQK